MCTLYLLPSTLYLLPSTLYLLPSTLHLLPSTLYFLLKYLVPTLPCTQYLVVLSTYLVPCTQVSSIHCRVYSYFRFQALYFNTCSCTFYLVPCILYLVPSTLYLYYYGTLYLVPCTIPYTFFCSHPGILIYCSLPLLFINVQHYLIPSTQALCFNSCFFFAHRLQFLSISLSKS